MKFTLAWLKRHLETTADANEIAEALTDLGLEVESIEDPAAKLGVFTICRVIEAVQHPNADRLRLCRVESWPNGADAPSEEVQVVCGAPNARTGMVGVFAPSGAHIPGTGVDLKPGVIRGVESNGMLCSERELMLSDDHDGVIDLPADAPLGARYIDYADLNDPMIEIAITPNRPDALGISGIARDLAARGLGRVITPPTAPVPGGFVSPISVTLHDDVADTACPLFVGRYIRGVKNGPSPTWLQQWLRAIGLRPISALVDITNFLTYDRGRPLHVFDADKVTGNIHVRLSRAGEKLLALDGKEYEFDDAMTLICDDAGPEAIGGVMGGELSGCTEETVNVFIESAYFDPIRTAATGRKLKINSDARYRFDRGVDPAFTPDGAELGAQMVLELCGGEASEPVVAGAVPDTARSYTLRHSRVESLVGMAVAPADQARILTDLGFGVTEQADSFDVSVPSFRPDVLGEADLVEEVARVTSLTGLKGEPLPRRRAGVGKTLLTPIQRRTGAVRRALAAAGLSECVTYSFVPERDAKLFGGGDPLMKVGNPISADLSDMRPSLLPGLMAAAARNQARGMGEIALFEVGPEFTGAEPGEQRVVAAGVRVGAEAPRNWISSHGPVDLYHAKADAAAALSAANAPVDRLMTFRDAPDWFHPGRSAHLKLGPKNTLAVFGELHPRVLDEMDVKGPAVAFVVYLENAPFPKSTTATRSALVRSDLQAVERDFAFVVDQQVEADKLLKAVRGADKTLIANVAVFDLFDGAKAAQQLGEGKKSLAITVRLQPRERTMTDEEIDEISARIVAAVQKSTDAELRK